MKILIGAMLCLLLIISVSGQYRNHEQIKPKVPDVQGPFFVSQQGHCKLYVIYHKNQPLYWSVCEHGYSGTITK